VKVSSYVISGHFRRRDLLDLETADVAEIPLKQLFVLKQEFSYFFPERYLSGDP